MHCPVCGIKNPQDSNFCQECGGKLSSKSKNEFKDKFIKTGKVLADPRKSPVLTVLKEIQKNTKRSPIICQSCGRIHNEEIVNFCEECGSELQKIKKKPFLFKNQYQIEQEKEEKDPNIRLRRKNKFRNGTARMILVAPKSNDNVPNAFGAAIFGLSGYALASGGRRAKVKVQVLADSLRIRGNFTADIPLDRLMMVTMEKKPSGIDKVVVHFEGIPSLEFLPDGKRSTYPSILYELLKPFEKISNTTFRT